jgi:uncharacterized protein YaeQ
MAQGATIYNFNISLSDMDRNVYETLDLRVALHPSEAVEHMLVRVLAYCMEYEEGISFSRGIAEADEPAVWVRDRTGKMLAWIDIGAPTAERLHRASKLAGRVVVYTHKNMDILMHNLGRQAIYKAGSIPIYAIEPKFLKEFEERLDRRLSFNLSITERQLYLDLDGQVLETTVVEHRME